MDWFRIAYWTSLVLLWVCIIANWWMIFRNHKTRKRLEAERKYCLSMITACNEFLEAAHKESGLIEEVADGLG